MKIFRGSQKCPLPVINALGVERSSAKIVKSMIFAFRVTEKNANRSFMLTLCPIFCLFWQSKTFVSSRNNIEGTAKVQEVGKENCK